MEPSDVGWGAQVEIDVLAPEQRIWAIVSDFSQHPTLAGSGEILAVRLSGPLAVGMTFLSDVKVGEVGLFTPSCEVSEVDEPRRLGWISRPPLDPGETEAHQIEVYWAFEMIPTSNGCALRHAVHIPRPKAGADELGEFFERTERIVTVRSGMQRTVENVKAAAESLG